MQLQQACIQRGLAEMVLLCTAPRQVPCAHPARQLLFLLHQSHVICSLHQHERSLVHHNDMEFTSQREQHADCTPHHHAALSPDTGAFKQLCKHAVSTELQVFGI